MFEALTTGNKTEFPTRRVKIPTTRSRCCHTTLLNAKCRLANEWNTHGDFFEKENCYSLAKLSSKFNTTFLTDTVYMLQWQFLLMSLLIRHLTISYLQYCHDIQSVCSLLSVTRVYCDKTIGGRITWFALRSSSTPQLFDDLARRCNSKEMPSAGDVKLRWMVFDLWRCMSETVRYRT